MLRARAYHPTHCSTCKRQILKGEMYRFEIDHRTTLRKRFCDHDLCSNAGKPVETPPEGKVVRRQLLI